MCGDIKERSNIDVFGDVLGYCILVLNYFSLPFATLLALHLL